MDIYGQYKGKLVQVAQISLEEDRLFIMEKKGVNDNGETALLSNVLEITSEKEETLKEVLTHFVKLVKDNQAEETFILDLDTILAQFDISVDGEFSYHLTAPWVPLDHNYVLIEEEYYIQVIHNYDEAITREGNTLSIQTPEMDLPINFTDSRLSDTDDIENVLEGEFKVKNGVVVISEFLKEFKELLYRDLELYIG